MVRTKKTILLTGVILFTVSLLFFSCENKKKTPEEMLTKSWRLKEFTVKGDNGVSPAIMSASSFTFKKDGNYEISLGEPDKGTWSLSEDKKILRTVSQPSGMVNEIDIQTITDTLVILVNNVGPNPVKMKLVPQ